jgi:Cu-Zn family superoxide dismutase
MSPNGEEMRIQGQLSGLRPNKKHGFHIHEYGDLSMGCASLCSHFNPDKKLHGGLTSRNHHAGDLGNIVSNSRGIAPVSLKSRLLKTWGKYNIIGRSIVVHEDEDDLGRGGHEDSHMTGHSGKRIGCAIIGHSPAKLAYRATTLPYSAPDPKKTCGKK